MIPGKSEKGLEVENRLRTFFKGKENDWDEVDFETSTSLYEVKSCRLFNITVNGNHLRPFRGSNPNKRIQGFQLGRFSIRTGNHVLLYLRSLQTLKVPKYIFVLRVRKQIIFKIVPWEEIKIIPDKEIHHIRISDIFGDYCVNER